MPKIVVNAFLTLDGVMQAPGGPDEDREGGFVHGGWQAPYADEVMGRLVTEGFADADGFLLGRKTYGIFANLLAQGHRPQQPHRDRAQLAAKVRAVAQPRACRLEQLQPDQG